MSIGSLTQTAIFISTLSGLLAWLSRWREPLSPHSRQFLVPLQMLGGYMALPPNLSFQGTARSRASGSLRRERQRNRKQRGQAPMALGAVRVQSTFGLPASESRKVGRPSLAAPSGTCLCIDRQPGKLTIPTKYRRRGASVQRGLSAADAPAARTDGFGAADKRYSFVLGLTPCSRSGAEPSSLF